MPISTELILALHLGSTAAMTGLIWFVQIVHYPLFAMVGEGRFRDYEAQHTKRTSRVVGPFMAAEGVTALWIAFDPGPDLGRILPVIGLVLLAIVHGSTVTLQVPRHRKLTAGYDPETARSLVTTNWIRTMAWTARAFLAAVMTI